MTTAEKTDLFKDWVKPEIKEDTFMTGLKVNNSLWPHENVRNLDFWIECCNEQKYSCKTKYGVFSLFRALLSLY